MRHIIFFLFISTTVFAQTPRLKFRQIQKDTTQGSIAISNPADSQLVFSRDFYIAYGADTVLILYGDTLAATSEIISSVLSDGVTITGDGTTGNELKVDTSTVIATKGDLSDYVTLSGTETITGAKTFTNTFTQSGGDANFDSGTLFVDATNNRVGIGTSSPQAPLTIAGPVNIIDPDTLNGSDANLFIYSINDINSTNGATDAEFAFYVAKRNSTSNLAGPYFYLTGNDFTRNAGNRGRLIFAAGAGLSSPTSNDGKVQFFTNGGSLTIEYDGDVVMTDNAYIQGTTLVTSDINLKNNVNDYYNGLDKIMNLRPVSFYLNNDKDNILNFGFIAQDVQEILPELVRRNNNTSSLYLNYDNFIPILVNGIKEQQAIIETQATEIDQLKTLITDLTNRIQILENK